MILFTHIPKTGGLSLSRDFWTALENRALVVNNVRELASFAADAPKAMIAGLEYVAGHVRLDDIEQHLRIDPADCFCFSVVRDPIERAFSLYLFIQRNPHLDAAFSKRIAGKAFDEFVRLAARITPLLSNPQCLALCGQADADSAIEAMSARYNLVAEIGRFADAHSMVREASGNVVPTWSPLRMRNVAPTAVQAEDIVKGWKPARIADLISAESRRTIAECSYEDFRLLEFINGRHGVLFLSAKPHGFVLGGNATALDQSSLDVKRQEIPDDVG